MSDQLFFIGLKAFIVNQMGEVLIIKRGENSEGQKGKWDLPGGRMEFGESIESALKREVLEESGMAASSILHPLSISTFLKSTNANHQIVRIIYLVSASGEVKLSSEHVEYKLIKPESHMKFEFPDKDFHKAFDQYIQTRSI